MLAPAVLLEAWEREFDIPRSARGIALLATHWPDLPAEHWRHLVIGARDRGLLELRSIAFGDTMEGLSRCPECGADIELTFSASALLDGTAPGDDEMHMVDANDYAVRLRSLRLSDLDAIRGFTDLTAARLTLLLCAIESASGPDGPVPSDRLPAEVLDAVETCLSAADPAADISFRVRCEDCAIEWEEPFDISTFLWDEVQAWAAMLLDDVHVLASAYGWCEQDVLRLSPRRRRVYLELVST